jgi:GNAT superfamily N-acetyltransferase
MTQDATSTPAAAFTRDQARIIEGVQRMLGLGLAWDEAEATALKRVQEGDLSAESLRALVAAAGTRAPREFIDRDRDIVKAIATLTEDGTVTAVQDWERFEQIYYYLREDAKDRFSDPYQHDDAVSDELARAQRAAWKHLYAVSREESNGLTLMQLRPIQSGGVTYKPFSESDDFADEWWVDDITGYHPAEQQFYSVHDGQNEVARVEVEIVDGLGEAYPAPSVSGPYGVIHFFEVSEDHRRRGYGAKTVELLEKHYGGLSLVADSEDADAFWGSLGWERLEHTDEPGSRTRYVSPGKGT